MNRIVAIVGRPNVGKSRLFNRLARRRISIVHDQPGVTRDVISTDVEDGQYTLLDTGGIGYKGVDTPAALTKASEQQVDFAIATASLILFVVDGLSGLSALDTNMAAQYRRALNSASPQQQAILQSTRDRFLAYRDRCPNRQCIGDAYVGRMREIRDIMEGRWSPNR